MTKSAEQSAIKRAPENGASDHAMTGNWRVIIARKGEKARTWYYNANDPDCFKTALRRVADEVFAKL